MFGKNKVSRIQLHQGNFLEIQEMFATIQGEGFNAGKPAIFIRLSGCNLQCSFCDTDFDSPKKIKVDEIIQQVEELSLNSNQQRVRDLIVITGGEPMLQPIAKLCNLLLRKKFKIQIETNGTIYRKIPLAVEIICSPKTTRGKYYPINPNLLKRIKAFKFLISANNPNYHDIANYAKEQKKIPIFIQPIDEYDQKKNQQNIQRIVDLSMQNGYLVSLQIHKILNIR
jgi:7-carboxy-7-deazaguanine synthase